MSTPPNAHLFNREALHVASVHRALTKSLKDLTANFHAMTAFGSHEAGTSLVVVSASTFEKSGARCVSVHFVGSVANIEFDSFSHGYSQTRKRVQAVNIADLEVVSAVKEIVSGMATIEPHFGSHVRQEERTAESDTRIQTDRLKRQENRPPFN